MTAAATAARVGDGLDSRWAALGLVVAGGLVEGTALGLAQSSVLAARLPGLRRRAYVVATVLIAGVGWAAASAPGVLSTDDGGDEPARALMVLGGAAIGLVMGPVLGGAQALALRGAAAAPRRWVLANTLAWPPVMVVIFAGATAPDASWSTLLVALTGAVTGVVAGTVLGVLTAAWLPQPVQRQPAQPPAQ
ncbi:hypothetical protein ASG76_14220 [Nocardioides sp. Soil774]|nr:hypothetical protein ASG76_14220 [Nocardioides sp. Soil774]